MNCLNKQLKSLPLLLVFTGVLFATGCSYFTGQTQKTLFEKVPSSVSNISFSNDLTPTQSHNLYTEANFYAGGGVGLGDINNNGLLDIYLVSNQGSNRLYLNKGNFEFEDITEQSGVGGSKPWSTGVSLVDINGNGYLDIYVTNSGPYDGVDRENELFINNGDLTFSESARKFGVADSGYSIHASFFDYNKDGYLDMYLLNNYAAESGGRGNLRPSNREERNFNGGDRLYRNDGERFTDVSEAAGIYGSEVSFGLGISVGDLNRNGWMDIYVSNDFFERDYLYLNNEDGTFREVLEEKLSSISTMSMGGDIADLDNDGFPEIFITDMLPETEQRFKTISEFPEWDQYLSEIEIGYHRKFMRNTFQYNNADGTFSEIGRYAGVEASDWSWGALMADFNQTGRRDIFVANGFYKDPTDKDHQIGFARGDMMNSVIVDGELDYLKLESTLPSNPIPNYMFENLGDLKFANRALEWGLAEPGFSHGSAYGDLNGNGALDLVVNNVNMEAFVYRNRSPEFYPERSWLQIELKGEAPNSFAVGAQVELVADGHYWFVEQLPQRGFQSSMDPLLHVGLGEGIDKVDSLEVKWPDGRVSLLTGEETRQRLTIRQSDAAVEGEKLLRSPALENTQGADPLLAEVTERTGIEWTHIESDFNDFELYPLLYHMRSTEGPPACSGDISGNGRDDFYVGGARGQPGSLFLQDETGEFMEAGQATLQADKASEDADCIFFDATGDGRSELYVASGSIEFVAGSPDLADRLYRMNEEGVFARMEQALPQPSDGHPPTSVVRAADMDGNGHLDLFVGARLKPFSYRERRGYGIPVRGYILKNNGNGQFEDMTAQLAPELMAGELGTAGITSAEWGDMNGNGEPDLVVAGEWMPLTVFYNKGGRLERASHRETGLANTSGWWQSLALADLNGNGRLDIVGGNHGLNSRFHATPEEPVEMWAGDFNRNGRIEQVFGIYNNGGLYPSALFHELFSELTYVLSDYQSYENYAKAKVPEILSLQQREEAVHHQVELLASVIGWNESDGSFRIEQLPCKAQWAPVYAILPQDLDGDGVPELLLGGNLDSAKPKAGPYDASFGTLLKQGLDGSYQYIPSRVSGFYSEGDIRSIQSLIQHDRTLLMVTRNNRELQFFAPAE